MGEAWAGQRSAKGSLEDSVKPINSVFWENFGLAPPIGSAKIIVQPTNLNDGMGEAWAGQRSAKGSLEDSVKVNVSVFWENFGFAPPIGSAISFSSN